MTTKYAPRTSTAALKVARADTGKANYVNQCQAWVCTRLFGTGAVGDYDGDKAADAEDGWKKAKDKGHVVLASAIKSYKDIPAGVQLFWTGGSHDYGHTAISETGGNCRMTGITNDPKISLRDIGYVARVWRNGLTFVGYATIEGNGYTLTDKPTAKTAVWGKPATWVLGAIGPDVTRLGERIVVWSKALGLKSPYKVGPGSPLGLADVAGLSKLQVAWGYGSTKADLAKGGNSDGYPGTATFAKLTSNPPVSPPPPVVGLEVEDISANLAGYDKVKGLKNRKTRAKTIIPDYLGKFDPLWFHFQECAIDMFPELDKRLTGYTRVSAGGKGRESYHKTGAVTIIEAKLMNVSHMLLKDTKEFLVIAWQKGEYKAVTANFHSENEGVVVQPLQLRDVMTAAREMADRHKISRRNILVTGDSNFKGAAAFAKVQRWTEALYSAKKKTGLDHVSTNGWKSALKAGLRIDVDITQADAIVLEASQLTGSVIADHWPHRLVRQLVK